MLFRFIATVASVTFIAQGALAAPALTIDQIVTSIGIVTTVSLQAPNTITSINPFSQPSDVHNAAQSVVDNFSTIIQSLAGDTTAMEATPQFSDCSATQAIVDAQIDFVRAHRDFQAIVRHKHPYFTQYGEAPPIANILESLKPGIDAFAKAMIAILPSCNTARVQGWQRVLDDSVGDTIAVYQQFCIPNPAYPSLMPLCFP